MNICKRCKNCDHPDEELAIEIIELAKELTDKKKITVVKKCKRCGCVWN